MGRLRYSPALDRNEFWHNWYDDYAAESTGQRVDKFHLLLAGHVESALSNIWEGAFKLTFGTLVIAAAFSSTFYSSRYDFSIAELMDVLKIGGVVSGVLLLSAQVIALRSKTAANAALASVTLACVFTAYVVHTEIFFPANRVAMLGICGAALFGLFVAFRVIDERRWGGLALSAAALIGIVLPIGQICSKDSALRAASCHWGIPDSG